MQACTFVITCLRSFFSILSDDCSIERLSGHTLVSEFTRLRASGINSFSSHKWYQFSKHLGWARGWVAPGAPSCFIRWSRLNPWSLRNINEFQVVLREYKWNFLPLNQTYFYPSLSKSSSGSLLMIARVRKCDSSQQLTRIWLESFDLDWEA